MTLLFTVVSASLYNNSTILTPENFTFPKIEDLVNYTSQPNINPIVAKIPPGIVAERLRQQTSDPCKD